MYPCARVSTLPPALSRAHSSHLLSSINLCLGRVSIPAASAGPGPRPMACICISVQCSLEQT
ncbi:hypothetical protein A6R68_23792 [Neotoma lepida]|uniref:Uncharacterized protein n=1 Tax=Neotoma lepida TaxID=56216 RepID=A0A1A6HWX2_NEOLE|nr:hypothetical protein A6R68_23792 [Neotoma lepida]